MHHFHCCFPLLYIISERPTSPYILLAHKKLYFVNSNLHWQMWTNYDIETSFMWITTFGGSLIKHLSSHLKWTRSTSKLPHSVWFTIEAFDDGDDTLECN